MKTLGTILTILLAMILAPAAYADGGPEPHSDLWHHQRDLAADKAFSTKQLAPGTCNLFTTTDTGHKDPGGLDKWVDVRVRILAKQCLGRRSHRWVRPVSATYTYNVEGGHQSCGYWDEFEGVRFRLYLSDGSGRNFSPAAVRLYCEQDTTAEHIQPLHNAPNFRYCWGFPKWRSPYTVIIDNWNDVSGDLKGILWDPRLPGPFPSEC